MDKKENQPKSAPQGAKGADAKHQGGAPQQKGPPQKAPSLPKKDYGANFRGIVRLAGRDLKGEMPLRRAIARVRGVGERLGSILGEAAMRELHLPDDIVVGLLTEEQMNKLEQMLIHPMQYGVPSYMLNRQKDPTTGEDLQLIGNDVRFYVSQDIENDKAIGTWRGYRHAYGQKVRGQHTRSTGRTGMTVGVQRSKILAAAAPKPAEGAAGAAPAAGAKPGAAGPAPKVGAAAVPKGGAAPAAGAKPAAGAAPAKGGDKKEAPKK